MIGCFCPACCKSGNAGLPHNYQTVTKVCAVCCANLTSRDPNTLTAHEFKCFKSNRALIPVHMRDKFIATLAWEKRSEAAKRGVETRRRNGGKRAPRKL